MQEELLVFKVSLNIVYPIHPGYITVQYFYDVWVCLFEYLDCFRHRHIGLTATEMDRRKLKEHM